MEQETTARIYEIGFNIIPTVNEKDREAVLASIDETITSRGGEFIARGEVEYIDLAYPMSKLFDNKKIIFNTAYFGWLKFEITPLKIIELKELFDKEKNILRYLMFKTVREDTFLKKKIGGSKKAKKEEAETEEVVIETEDFETELPHEKIEKLEKEAMDVISGDETKSEETAQ